MVHAQSFRNMIDPRLLHLVAIPLLLHGPFYLLVTFDTSRLFFPNLEFYLPELWCIHHIFLQMLLDDFCQIASPCLLVLFGNEWRTLLSVEGMQGKWFELKMPKIVFVLGINITY